MKYTDGLFVFPVRVYDGASVRRALKREEDVDVSIDADWVEGKARIPLAEIIGVVDYIPRGSSIDTIEQDGYDCCAVLTRSLGDFICNVSGDEFERMANRFAEKYVNELADMVEERQLDEEEAPPEKKKKWWRW